jgi:hypothetical protein
MRATTLLIASLTGAITVASAQGNQAFNPVVYQAAVPAMLGGKAPAPVLVGPMSVRLRLSDSVVMRGGQVNERLHQYDAIPSGLPEQLDAMSITPRPVAELGLPPGYSVIDDSSAALLTAGNWAAFRRTTRAPRGVVHLTPVAYSENGGTALVGLIWDCGPGCRQLHAAWLVPDGSGGWAVQGTHRFPTR